MQRQIKQIPRGLNWQKKSLVAKKCKPYDIYWRVRDKYQKVCFIKKKLTVTNGLNMDFPLRAWVEKLSIELRHTDSQEKKNSGCIGP